MKGIQLDASETKLRLDKLEQRREVEVTAGGASVVKKADEPASKFQLNNKVDHLEQASLSDTLMFQGPAIDSLIVKTETASNIPRSDQIKTALVTELNSISSDMVVVETFASVGVYGKDKKHIKVRFANNDKRIDTLKTIKRLKPLNLFVSEYLTKCRATLFYKMRCLKKENNVIESVFTMNGSVICKKTGIDRFFYVNNQEDYRKFEEGIKGESSDSEAVIDNITG